MSRTAPLFVDEKRAAELFCIKPQQFRGLVEAGHLPGALKRGGVERWDVEELTRIWRGDAIEGGGFEW